MRKATSKDQQFLIQKTSFIKVKHEAIMWKATKITDALIYMRKRIRTLVNDKYHIMRTV